MLRDESLPWLVEFLVIVLGCVVGLQLVLGETVHLVPALGGAIAAIAAMALLHQKQRSP